MEALAKRLQESNKLPYKQSEQQVLGISLH